MKNRNLFYILDLAHHFNGDGISSDDNLADGDFAGDYTYPEEDLPSSNSIFECDGIVFRFPDKGDGTDNNIALEGQRIQVPQDRYDSLYLLGASDYIGLEDAILLILTDDHREEAFLGLSAWSSGRNLQYGERAAIRCSGYHSPIQHVYTDRLGVVYGICSLVVSIEEAKVLRRKLWRKGG